MPSDAKDSISNLVNVFSALNKMREEPKGVSAHRTIIKDNEDSVDPSLSSSENTRLKNVATILGKVWQLGEFAPKPEAERLNDLTPDKQKALGISAVSDKVKPVQVKREDKTDWLSTLLKVLGAAVGAGLLWAMLPEDLKKKIKETVTKWVTELGSLIGEYAPKIWTELWEGTGPAGKVRFIQRISKPILAIMDALITGITKTVRGYKALTNLFRGPAKPPKVKIDEGGAVGRRGTTGKPRTTPATPPTPRTTPATPPTPRTIKYRDPVTGRIAAKPVTPPTRMSKISNFFKGKADAVARSASAIGTSARVLGTKGVSAIGTSARVLGTKALAITEPITRLFNGPTGRGIFNVAKGAGKVARAVLRIPFLAEAVEAATFVYYKGKQKDLYEKGKITADEYNYNVGARAINSMGGVLGGLSGVALVAALSVPGAIASGGLLAPLIPLLAIGGGFVGDFIGRRLADALVNASPEFTSTIGRWATGTSDSQVQIGELQDFIIQNGVIVPFSDKDKLLSMKKDGAFDNLFKSGTDSTMVTEIISYNKFAKTALVSQINRQDKMIDLLVAIARKSFSSNTILQQPQQSQNYSGANFRDDYNYQTLATN